MISTEIFVEDTIKIDDASIDKSNKYSTENASIIHDTDSYMIKKLIGSSSGANYGSHVYITDLNELQGNYEISIDLKFTNSEFVGILLLNSFETNSNNMEQIELFNYSNNKCGFVTRHNNQFNSYRGSNQLSTGIWYNFTLKVENTNVTGIITRLTDDTILYNSTYSFSWVQDYKKMSVGMLSSITTAYFKNLKIKLL